MGRQTKRKVLFLRLQAKELYAPVEIAGYSAWLQSMVKPRFALTINIGLPVVFVAFKESIRVARVRIYREVKPVFGVAHNRNTSTKRRFGIDKISSIQRCTAVLTLVAISFSKPQCGHVPVMYLSARKV